MVKSEYHNEELASHSPTTNITSNLKEASSNYAAILPKQFLKGHILIGWYLCLMHYLFTYLYS